MFERTTTLLLDEIERLARDRAEADPETEKAST
jgi:hypothetical protein